MEQVCEQVLVSCPESCGGKCLRGKVTAPVYAASIDLIIIECVFHYPMQLMEHYQTDCSKFERDCTYKDVGCTVKVGR